MDVWLTRQAGFTICLYDALYGTICSYSTKTYNIKSIGQSLAIGKETPANTGGSIDKGREYLRREGYFSEDFL